MSPIFTIGYGNRSISNFTKLLSEYGITTLIDVRSRPYSRFNPNYNKATLQSTLKDIGIAYLYMGDTLGGKPKDQGLYTAGKLDYKAVNINQSYQSAIATLIEKKETQIICLMCAELNPDTCHRKNLIGETLIKNNVKVNHIDQRGFLSQQSAFTVLELF